MHVLHVRFPYEHHSCTCAYFSLTVQTVEKASIEDFFLDPSNAAKLTDMLPDEMLHERVDCHKVYEVTGNKTECKKWTENLCSKYEMLRNAERL